MGIKVETTPLGGVKFSNRARGHVLICDQPLEGGGEDAGPTPVELFLASIGSCAGVYVVSYCKHRGLDSSEIRIEVEGEKAKEPHRIGTLNIRILVPQHFSEKDRLGIQRSADNCLVKNTLVVAPSIRTEVLEG